MKRNFLTSLAILALSAGCSTTTITRTETDGTQFQARNTRFFWQSKGVEIEYNRNGTNVTSKARLDQSGTDAEALRAVAEGAAKGAAGK